MIIKYYLFQSEEDKQLLEELNLLVERLTVSVQIVPCSVSRAGVIYRNINIC